MDHQLLLTPQEVAARLQLGRTKVYHLLRCADLPTIRLARSLRFPAQALDTWLAADRQGDDVEDTRLAG